MIQNRPKRRTGPRLKPMYRKKICRFCAQKKDITDYKDIEVLRRFVTERGKILPRTVTGNCSKHQRQLTKAVKRARNIALLHYKNQ